MARHRRKSSEKKTPPSLIEQDRSNRQARVAAIDHNLGIIRVLTGALNEANDAKTLPRITVNAYMGWQDEHLAETIHDGIVAAAERRTLRQTEWLSVPQEVEIVNAVLQHSGEAALSLTVVVHPLIVVGGLPSISQQA